MFLMQCVCNTCNQVCNQPVDNDYTIMIVFVAIVLILWGAGMIYDIKCTPPNDCDD